MKKLLCVLIVMTSFLAAVGCTTPVLESVSILSLPQKLEYNVGEQNLDLNEGKLELKYNTKTEQINMNHADISVDGFNTQESGTKTITLTYLGFNVQFDITVKPVIDTLSVLTTPKTQYFLGEQLDLNGGVLLVSYTDPTPDLEIDMTNTDIIISGFDNQTAGTQTITLTYKNKNASFEVEVKADPTLPIIELIPTLSEIEWNSTHDFSLTNEQKQAASTAFQAFNALSAQDKERIAEHRTLIVSSMFAVDYTEFKQSNSAIYLTIEQFSQGISFNQATNSPHSTPLDTLTLVNKYNNLKDTQLYITEQTPTTINDIITQLYLIEHNWEEIRQIISNALDMFKGFDTLTSNAPYGEEILDHPLIELAYESITKLSLEQIENARPLVASWNTYYVETLYEYFYYLNETINCTQIDMLASKLIPSVFEMLNFQLEMMYGSYNMLDQGFYVLFVSIYEGIIATVDQLYQEFADFEAILALYEHYTFGWETSIMTQVDEYAIEQFLFIYLLAGDLMENEEFMSVLTTLFKMISDTYTDQGYVSGSTKFDDDFKALMNSVNSLSLSLQFNFYSAQQGYYAMLLDDYFFYYLNEEEYLVYDTFMNAFYEYFYFQFGYSEDETIFLSSMEQAIDLYNQLEKSDNFDAHLSSQFQIYKAHYENLKAVRDNEQFSILIEQIKAAFQKTYDGYLMYAVYHDSTYMMIYFPALETLVNQVYSTQNSVLISLFESYAIYGDTMLGVYDEFKGVHDYITEGMSAAELAFSTKIVEISAKIMIDGREDVWDISDKSHYEGDYNLDMSELISMFIDLNANEKSRVICEHNVFIELLFMDYFSSVLSVQEMAVFSLLLDAAFEHAIYLSPNYPNISSPSRFNQAKTLLIQAYNSLENKTNFDIVLGALYQFYIAQ